MPTRLSISSILAKEGWCTGISFYPELAASFLILPHLKRIIEEVKQYQVTGYTFSRSEPLYTFLAELPVLTEGQLFDLSLWREPRKAK